MKRLSAALVVVFGALVVVLFVVDLVEVFFSSSFSWTEQGLRSMEQGRKGFTLAQNRLRIEGGDSDNVWSMKPPCALHVECAPMGPSLRRARPTDC